MGTSFRSYRPEQSGRLTVPSCWPFPNIADCEHFPVFAWHEPGKRTEGYLVAVASTTLRKTAHAVAVYSIRDRPASSSNR